MNVREVKPVRRRNDGEADGPVGRCALLDEKQAATYLNRSVRALQDDRLRGKGCRYVKLGRSVRYRREDLDAWVESNLRSHTSEAR